MSDKKTIEQEVFSWDGWDQSDTASFVFYDVQFEKDFGVFKKGEHLDSISLDYVGATLTQWSNDGKVVRQQAIALTPVD